MKQAVLSKYNPRGFLMLEVLVSIGLLAIILATIGSLVLTSTGTMQGDQAIRSSWAVQEGLSALQSISFSDLSLTTVGSLTFSNNRWTLGEGAPQTIAQGITRTVRVKQVNRNASCQIVTIDGTSDTDSRQLESEVTWIDQAGRSHTTTQSALRTRWENPQGSCFMPSQANCSSIDYVTNGQWFGGKQLREVYFTNTCTGATLVIDKIIFTWNNGSEIEQVFIDSTKIWSESGPGTPSGEQLTGTTLDVQNYSLSPGVQYELNKVQFEDQMSGTTITITLIFTDGTSLTTPPFIPSG